MSDKITSITETEDRDRAGLNIKSVNKGKKILITFAFLLIGFIIVLISLLLALDQLPKKSNKQDIKVVNTQLPDYAAGGTRSRLADTAAIFEKLSANKQVNEEKNALNTPEYPLVTIPIKSAQQKPIVSIIHRNINVSNEQIKTPTPTQLIEYRKLNSSVMVDVPQENSQVQQINQNESLTTENFANGIAFRRRAGALDFMLIHGTAIPCALVTQIISDYEGLVRCQVTQDVYSANGNTLLIERGSSVSGTQKVALEQGKNRIFTNWASIDTPLGISIRIDSLGVGELGATGNKAWVDNHFAQRFGGAILLSFVDDALGTLSESVNKHSDVQFDNSTNNASNMAEKALDSSINIAPTGYAYIGQRINILVARNVDMSSVYEFAPLR